MTTIREDLKQAEHVWLAVNGILATCCKSA